MKMTNDGGVLLAVDYRATGEMHIGSACMKIIEINKFLLGTMAGGAADCTYWERVLSKQVIGVFLCVLEKDRNNTMMNHH